MSERRRTLEALVADRQYHEKRAAFEEGVMRDSITKVAHIEEALSAVREAVKLVQEGTIARVEDLVSRCLADVFGSSAYTFRVFVEEKRGKTETRLAFVRDGNEYVPGMETGFGPVDVAAFALRLMAVILSRPPRRRLIVADEPFRHLAVRYHEQIRGMIEEVSEELGVQVLIITHSEGLRTGEVIEIGD